MHEPRKLSYKTIHLWPRVCAHPLRWISLCSGDEVFIYLFVLGFKHRVLCTVENEHFQVVFLPFPLPQYLVQNGQGSYLSQVPFSCGRFSLVISSLFSCRSESVWILFKPGFLQSIFAFRLRLGLSQGTPIMQITGGSRGWSRHVL